jgi:YVTN family beta-propeller protein
MRRLWLFLVVLAGGSPAHADAELERWTVVDRVKTGSMPWGVSTSADGATLYVTHVGEKDRDNVRRYDAETLDVTARARFRGHAVESALSDDGDTLFVTNSRRHRVVVLDPQTLETRGHHATGLTPKDFRIAPDGKRLYTADYGGGTMSVISLPSGERTSVGVGRHPRGIAIAPDGKRVYVVNMGSGTVSVVDAGTLKVTATWNACPAARHAQVAGDRLLVTCYGGRQVVVLDAATGKQVRRIPVGSGPKTIAVSRDGAFAITADERGGTATFIDLTTYRTSTLRLGAVQPCGVAIAPDGERAYVTARGSDELIVIARPEPRREPTER